MSIENIQIIETVSLDFYNNNIKTINVKQMDTDARGVKINCTEHGKKFKLDPLSHSAFVRYKKPDGYDVFNDCYIQDDGSIIFALTQQMTAIAGKSKLDILIFCSSGLTVADIGDISNFNDLGIATLSTMTLGLNIHENATDLSNVESSYEYDALIEGLARHVAIEKHMEELEFTINANETQRQDNETTRQINETARQSAESMREINESDRQTAETSRVKAEQTRENNIKTAISNCENAVANADTATTNAQQATSDATTKTTEMQALIDTFNQNVNGVINDETVSDLTTYSSQKIQDVVEIVNYKTEQLYNQNLFINGCFQIWSNGNKFTLGINSDGTYGGYYDTADKWTIYTQGSSLIEVTRTSKGMYLSRSNAYPVQIFQVLDKETIISLLGKKVTLSYSYQYDGDNSPIQFEKNIILENIDLENINPFVIAEEYFSFDFHPNSTLLCAKLEVGEIATPCVPDAKDSIICKLEKRMQFNYAKQSIYSPNEITINKNQIVSFPTANNVIYGDSFEIKNSEFIIGKEVSLVRINVNMDGSFEDTTFLYVLKNDVSICNHFVDTDSYTGRSFTEIIQVAEGDRIGLSVNRSVILGTAGLNTHFTIERLV